MKKLLSTLLLIVLLVLVVLLLILLLLQLLPCIDIVLLGLQVPGIPQKRLLKSIHSRLPVLLGDGHITEIIVIVSSSLRSRSCLLHPVQHLSGLLHITLSVQCVRKIIVCGHRSGILNQGLAIVYVGFAVILLLEVPVAPPHVTDILLCHRAQNRRT